MGRVHKSPRQRCVASHGFMRVKGKEKNKEKRREADTEREEMESGGCCGGSALLCRKNRLSVLKPASLFLFNNFFPNPFT